MFYWFIKGIAWPLRALYFRIEATGLEHFPRRGPAILIANHSSYLDAGVLGAMLPRKIRFIVLSRMYTMWRIRWFYLGMETIPVHPGRPDHSAIRRALAVLGAGGVIGIFPEGGRSPDGLLQKPLPGAALIAVKSGAPVVPAAITGAFEAFPRGRVLPSPRKIRLRLGRPFQLSPEAGRRAGRRELARHSARMMEEIAALLRERDVAVGASREEAR